MTNDLVSSEVTYEHGLGAVNIREKIATFDR